MKIEDFSKNGYLVVKNCLTTGILKKIRNEVLKNNNSSYKEFCKAISKLNESDFFTFLNPININLLNKNLISEILLQKKIYDVLVKLLGSDLAVSCESSLTLNIKESKKNYYFKDWHQEIWSGADISHLQLWSPIFQKTSSFGQLAFIQKSHQWGLVPNSDRRPVNLPKKYKIIQTKLEFGDLLIFSTTLLHKTMITKFPRLGIAMTVKNFKYSDESYSKNINWKIFSYSEISKLQRVLGNHYLSPFRLLNIESKIKLN
jgi:ectoine hydroxylase-related dioxygenase (phytanoyl-CoA dioxygenase family)